MIEASREQHTVSNTANRYNGKRSRAYAREYPSSSVRWL